MHMPLAVVNFPVDGFSTARKTLSSLTANGMCVVSLQPTTTHGRASAAASALDPRVIECQAPRLVCEYQDVGSQSKCRTYLQSI